MLLALGQDSPPNFPEVLLHHTQDKMQGAIWRTLGSKVNEGSGSQMHPIP